MWFDVGLTSKQTARSGPQSLKAKPTLLMPAPFEWQSAYESSPPPLFLGCKPTQAFGSNTTCDWPFAFSIDSMRSTSWTILPSSELVAASYTASEIRASTRPWQMQIDKIEDDDGRSEIQNLNRRRCPMHVDNKARTHSERTHADSTNPAPTCAEQQWKYNRAGKTNHIKCSNFARQILLTPGYTSSINSPLTELLTGYN